MDDKKVSIVVNGDACVDWHQWPVSQNDHGYNWEADKRYERTAVPGGTLLLSKFINTALKSTEGDISISSPDISGIENIPSASILHSSADLMGIPLTSDKKDKDKLVLRIARFNGYTGPYEGIVPALDILNDDPDADVVVLNDYGDGFKEQVDKWPEAIKTSGRTPIVIYKMSKPVMSGKLWDHLKRNHFERLLIIIDADDFREEGITISRCLSWERTALDSVWQMARNPKLFPLIGCRNLLIRFGSEGVVHYTNDGEDIKSYLYFYPDSIEGSFKDRYPGKVQGSGVIFTVSITLSAARCILSGESMKSVLREGIKAGMEHSLSLLKNGYGGNLNNPDFMHDEIFTHPLSDSIGEIEIPFPDDYESSDPSYWSILKDISSIRLEELAYRIVKIGDKKAVKSIPMGNFGKLRTADRSEIEGFRSIKNLMLEYIGAKSISRPLSIGVFGFPGSGKSFGVTEVAESIAPNLVEKVEFNLSQFRSPSDLVEAFHKVRDIVLKGSIPLVFFDEFDSYYDGKLGWLKYFLAPMQDGIFRDGENIHPIGKSIFVFAGGTCSTFQEFSRDSRDESLVSSSISEFKDAKGPDFVSRLRGYVNISGPNPLSSGDFTYVIRRAMLLRSMIERKAKQLIDNSGNARIDEEMLRALIKVPYYRHGARSMEAIIDMSMLNGRTHWEQTLLPSKEQMKLHVDEEMLMRLMNRDIIFGAAREILGKAAHESYLKEWEGKRSPDDPSMQPWEKLDEGLKESSRCQADHIPEKLRSIGCGFMPAQGNGPKEFLYTNDEIEKLSRVEHERWVSERLLAGWTYGKERDVKNKKSPYIVPWEDLTEDIRELDRKAVLTIPELLKKVGFEIYRMD